MDGDLEMIEMVGTGDEGDLFDPAEAGLGPAGGIVAGVIFGSCLWMILILALWSIGIALFGE